VRECVEKINIRGIYSLIYLNKLKLVLKNPRINRRTRFSSPDQEVRESKTRHLPPSGGNTQVQETAETCERAATMEQRHTDKTTKHKHICDK